MKAWSLAILLFPVQLVAQDSCSCMGNLERYVDTVTRNYSGFQDKVKPADQVRYHALLDSLRSVAANTTDKTLCFGVLDAYRRYFWDKHLQLGGPNMPSALGSSAPPIITTWTAATLNAYFAEHANDLRPLEGIWALEAYEVGMVFDPSSTTYRAMIMRSANEQWKEGMVKFTCPASVDGRMTARYWRGDLGMMETGATVVQHHLLLDHIGTWRRIVPAPTEAIDERAFELTYGSEVQWKLLDDSTLYIKLGSCQLSNKAILDSLVKANKELLDRIPNWIVDFRDNGGGSTDVFQSLLPYLYTRPFKEYGVSHWLSPDNTAVLNDFLQENERMMDPASARSIRALVKQGRAHPNTWHIGGGATTRFKKHDMPRRVAVLANRGTASSGESFVEVTRGISGKAVIFGENTGGFMDYGDVMPHDLRCDGLGAAIPTSRMNRIDHGMVYDKEGIAPDVRISANEVDVIGFVQRYWTKR